MNTVRHRAGLAHIGHNKPYGKPPFLLRQSMSAQCIWLGLTVGALGASPSLAWAQEALRAAPGARADTEASLPQVTVKGQAGGVTAPYAGGQVTSGGRVGLLGDKDFMETPFNAINYTDEFVANRQAQSVTDVIAATDPTVFSNGVTGAWSENYSIRGFSSGASDMSMGGLYGMAPYYRTTPEMFERIEVLKGPSALLNGMPPGGSVGGAVNLVPKRAGNAPLTRLTTSYLSNSQFGGHLDLGRRFGESQQFGVRFNGVYRDGESAIKHQDKNAQLASLGLDWRGTRARVSADFYSSNDRIDGVTRGIGLGPGLGVPKAPRPDTLLNPDWSYAHTKDKAVMVRGEWDLNDQVMAYAAFGMSESDYEYSGAISSQMLNAAGDYKTTMGQLKFNVEKKSGDVGLKGRLLTGAVKHQWAVNATHYAHTQNDYGRRSVPGGDWTTNLYQPVWGAAPAFVAPHIAHSEVRLVSYGVADTLSFAEDRVQLTLGVRRQQVVSDVFSVATGARTSRYDKSATSPAAALLVKATDKLAVYANYIEGLSQGAKAPINSANPDDVFAPYKTQQKEVGLKLDQGEFAHTFSLFEITRPSSYTDPTTNIFSFDGEQRNRGVEWGFFGTPAHGLRLMGGIAYTTPKVTRSAVAGSQGKMATGVPKWQGKLGAEWDMPAAQGLTLLANATAVSKQFIAADNSLWAPGRVTFDVGARYATHMAGKPVTLRATVMNITNKAYWGQPLLSSLSLGAPRTFALSASIDF